MVVVNPPERKIAKDAKADGEIKPVNGQNKPRVAFWVIGDSTPESPFSHVSRPKNIPNCLTWYQILAAGCFITGFLLQFQTVIIFSNLGSISTKHVMPVGGFFKCVSNPHYLGEIIMYLSLAIILLGNTCMPYAAAWVVINQVESALLSHWWYLSKFEDYPKERKAVIPFIL